MDLRFPTALQAMLSLALAHEAGVDRVSSSELAAGLGANPSLVRRLLAQLVARGLVKSTVGKSGGLSLARAAETVTLAEIYVAAIEQKPLWVARSDIPHRCVVTSNIEEYFDELAADAQKTLIDRLEKTTLEESLTRLRVLDRQTNRRSQKRGTTRRRAS